MFSLNIRHLPMLLLVPLLLLVAQFLSSSPEIISKTEAAAPPNKLRVLEVRYFPRGESDLLYHPDNLSTNLQGMIETSSKFHGYSNPDAPAYIDVEIVDVYDRMSARPNPNGTWYSTYEAVLADGNLCTTINTQEIDQIWMWVDPRAGYDPGPGVEYTISSPYFQDGAQFAYFANPAFCGGERSFSFMGFDYSRPADYALHSFAHMMEGVLGNVQTVELFWYRFGGNTAQGFPLSQRCGNVHFPPNGTADYNYSNTTYVNTFCEDWNPQGTGVTSNYNCTRWGCNQQGFLKWWMQNMPQNNGLTYEGRLLPNWWDFIYDMDLNFQYYINDADYFLDRGFLGVTPCYLSKAQASGASSYTINHLGCEGDELVAVIVGYRATASWTNHKISSMTYGGNAMSFGCRENSNEYTTEVWYSTAPFNGGRDIVMNWTLGEAKDVHIGVMSYSNVDDRNPVSFVACNDDGGLWQSNPILGKNPEVSISTYENQRVFAAMTTYTGGVNQITLDNGHEEWNQRTINVVSSGATKNGADTTTTVGWTGTVNWHWSTGALAVNDPQPNQAPLIQPISDQTMRSGYVFTYDANADDADPVETLTYSLEQAPAGMTIDAQTGVITWATSRLNLGAFNIVVKVEDSMMASDSEDFVLTLERKSYGF